MNRIIIKREGGVCVCIITNKPRLLGFMGRYLGELESFIKMSTKEKVSIMFGSPFP